MVKLNLCTTLILFTANVWAKPVDTNPRIDDSGLNNRDESQAKTLKAIKNITASEKVAFEAPVNVQGFNGTALGGSSGATWSQLVPPYDDFENITDTAMLDRPDSDVFFYTPENVKSSRVFEWNMAWTMKYADHPNMTDPNYGEDWLKARLLLDRPDYACGISEYGCTQYDRDFILRKYPDPKDRAKAQRIYLIFEANYINHQIERMKLRTLVDVHLFLSAYKTDLVKFSTKQVDKRAQEACRVMHENAKFAVELAVSFLAAAAGGMMNGLTAKGGPMEWASTNMFKSVELGREKPEWQKAANFEWAAAVRTVFFTKISEKSGDRLKVHHDNKIHHFGDQEDDVTPSHSEGNATSRLSNGKSTFRLNPGMDDDGLCNSWGGGRQDHNAENVEIVDKIVSGDMSVLRNSYRDAYTRLSKGMFFPSGPSMKSFMYLNHPPAPRHGPHEEDRERKSLNEENDFVRNLKEQILKYFMGNVLAQDGNWIKCVRLKNAQEQCALKPEEQPKEHLRNFRASMFCPRPVTDPTLVCVAERWYHAKDYGSHVESVAGMKDGVHAYDHWHLPELQSDEPGGFDHFVFKKLLHESFDAFELYGNMPKLEDKNLLKGPVFQMPTCIGPGPGNDFYLHNMNDYGHNPTKFHASYLQIPFRCGNTWQASETPKFVEMLNLGKGSPGWEVWEGGFGTRHPPALYWDRVPRLIYEAHLTPVAEYVNYCHWNLRLPQVQPYHDYWSRMATDPANTARRPHLERDIDCDLVINGTRNMTETRANTWFCENQGKHTIFKRQWWYHSIPETNLDWIKNSDLQCRKWLKLPEQIKAKEERKKEKKKQMELLKNATSSSPHLSTPTMLSNTKSATERTSFSLSQTTASGSLLSSSHLASSMLSSSSFTKPVTSSSSSQSTFASSPLSSSHLASSTLSSTSFTQPITSSSSSRSTFASSLLSSSHLAPSTYPSSTPGTQVSSSSSQTTTSSPQSSSTLSSQSMLSSTDSQSQTTSSVSSPASTISSALFSLSTPTSFSGSSSVSPAASTVSSAPFSLSTPTDFSVSSSASVHSTVTSQAPAFEEMEPEEDDEEDDEDDDEDDEDENEDSELSTWERKMLRAWRDLGEEPRLAMQKNEDDEGDPEERVKYPEEMYAEEMYAEEM